MGGVVEVPLGLFVATTVYVGITGLVGIVVALLAGPALIINRPRSAYWNDWNSSLKAPWLFWKIGALWYRIAELLGNYILPAPQRVSDMASAYFRSQVHRFKTAAISARPPGIPSHLIIVDGRAMWHTK